MPLSRIWWLATVVVCAIAALILFLSGYQGYGAILVAVGLSAAINLA
jgi:predicted cobalt transporter CbtA